MIKEISYEEYYKFAKELEQTHFLHSIEWAKFREKIDWNYSIIGIYYHDNLICTALLLSKVVFKGKKFFYIPRGMILDYHNVAHVKVVKSELEVYVKENGGIFCRIDPGIKYRDIDPDGHVIKNGLDNSGVVNNLIDAGFIHRGFIQEFEGMQPRFTFRVNLKNRTKDDILKSMDSKTRYNTKIGPKRGIEIIESDELEIDTFYKLMEDTAERDGFIVRSKEYFTLLEETVDKENRSFAKQYFAHLNPIKYEKEIIKEDFEIINALEKLEKQIKEMTAEEKAGKKYQKLLNQQKEYEKRQEQNTKKKEELNDIQKNYPEGIELATAICIIHDNKCWHLFGASSEEYIQFRAVYQLINHMIMDSYDNGYEFFDHFGSPGNTSADGINYGLYHFKKGFGGEFIEFIGEFDLVINKFYYNIFINLIQKAQSSNQNIFLKYLLKVINIFR